MSAQRGESSRGGAGAGRSRDTDARRVNSEDAIAIAIANDTISPLNSIANSRIVIYSTISEASYLREENNANNGVWLLFFARESAAAYHTVARGRDVLRGVCRGTL